MIDKQIQISDISLSEKDIIQEKDNSILNKSFFSADFNFPDLVSKKNYLQIKLESLVLNIKLTSKSIKKIFSLISDNQDLLENNYLDYITCLIGESEELDRQQLLNSNGNPESHPILDPTYYELLKKTKIYYIDIPKLNLDNKINKRITLKNISLEKISSFLNMNVFDISDYIEIYILAYQEKESLGERFLLRAKLMGKLSYDNIENINNENEKFMGIKNFPIDIKESEKCNKNKIQFMDYYFNNVWNAIEKENIKDENLSFSETPYGKTLSIDINNKNNNNKKIDNNLPNSYDIEKSGIINKNRELSDDNTCSKLVCGNICEIF